MRTKTLAATLLTATALTLPLTSFAHEGRWHHRDHDGFGPLGWLVVGTVATAAAIASLPRVIEPAPVYVQPPLPAPAPVASSAMWYYCAAAGRYYPYVTACPAGWTLVPANPSGMY